MFPQPNPNYPIAPVPRRAHNETSSVVAPMRTQRQANPGRIGLVDADRIGSFKRTVPTARLSVNISKFLLDFNQFVSVETFFITNGPV